MQIIVIVLNFTLLSQFYIFTLSRFCFSINSRSSFLHIVNSIKYCFKIFTIYKRFCIIIFIFITILILKFFVLLYKINNSIKYNSLSSNKQSKNSSNVTFYRSFRNFIYTKFLNYLRIEKSIVMRCILTKILKKHYHALNRVKVQR